MAVVKRDLFESLLSDIFVNIFIGGCFLNSVLIRQILIIIQGILWFYFWILFLNQGILFIFHMISQGIFAVLLEV